MGEAGTSSHHFRNLTANKDSTMIIHAKLKKSILVNFTGNLKKDRIVLKKICRMFKSLTIADLIYS